MLPMPDTRPLENPWEVPGSCGFKPPTRRDTTNTQTENAQMIARTNPPSQRSNSLVQPNPIQSNPIQKLHNTKSCILTMRITNIYTVLGMHASKANVRSHNSIRGNNIKKEKQKTSSQDCVSHLFFPVSGLSTSLFRRLPSRCCRRLQRWHGSCPSSSRRGTNRARY